MIQVYTEHTGKSDYVVSEVELAFKYNVKILPFKMVDTEMNEVLEYYFNYRHWFEATSPPLE